jgi:DeoR/GlpR family transcriptional regulator of sugar metabolism
MKNRSKQKTRDDATSKDSAVPFLVRPTGHQQLMPRGAYIQMKLSAHDEVKRVIAKHVATEYVHDFDSVLLDAGSSAEFIAEAMFSNRRYLSVLTNNMGAYAAYTRAIAQTGESLLTDAGGMKPGIRGLLSENELLLPGGRYDPTYEALFGKPAVDAIKKFSPNITIIGVSGLRWGAEEGVFCHGSEEVELKELLLKIGTDTRLIATDWTKIGKRDAHSFGLLEKLAVNARRGVVVTVSPPRTADAEVRREFDEQVKKMQDAQIDVDIVPTLE